jgi:hypothetical protein
VDALKRGHFWIKITGFEFMGGGGDYQALCSHHQGTGGVELMKKEEQNNDERKERDRHPALECNVPEELCSHIHKSLIQTQPC